MSKLVGSVGWGLLLLGCGAGAGPSAVSAPAASPPATQPREAESAVATAPPASDQEAALATWQGYRSALVNRNGVRGVSVVTPESVAEYARYRSLALTMSRADLREAELVDRMMVLMLRGRLSTERLRSLNGESLLALAIERGWVGSDLPKDIHVKRIEGDVAYFTFVREGKELEGEVPGLRRVDNRWLVDLVEILRLARPAILKTVSDIAKQRGTDINGALLYVVEVLVGEPPPDSIWDPPL